MKKTLPTLSLIIIISAFYSCKKDAAVTIKGKWSWVENTADTYNNGVLVDHEDVTKINPAAFCEFEDNNVFIENPPDSLGNLRYGTYTIKGDSLLILENGQTEQAGNLIKTLTSSRLVLHRTFQSITSREEIEYTFKK